MKKRRKKKKQIYFILLFILSIIIIILGCNLYSITEYHSFQVYGWEFYKDHLENAILRDLEISYDFTTSQGIISFEIESFNISPEHKKIFDVFIPGRINNYHIQKNNLEITNLTSLRIYNDSSLSQITIWDDNLEEKDKFKISYSVKDLFPNGQFNFEHKNFLIAGKAIINLNLGKRYICEKKCIKDLYFLEEKYTSDFNIINLKISREGIPDTHSFKIYTRENVTGEIALLTSVSIALIVILIQELLSFLKKE